MPWKKGQSGNPGGRPRGFGDIREIVREYTHEAVRALVKVCTSGKSESARVAAATVLLDRGYGKPVQSIHTTPNNPAELTDNELAAIAARGRNGAASPTPDPTLLN